MLARVGVPSGCFDGLVSDARAALAPVSHCDHLGSLVAATSGPCRQRGHHAPHPLTFSSLHLTMRLPPPPGGRPRWPHEVPPQPIQALSPLSRWRAGVPPPPSRLQKSGRRRRRGGRQRRPRLGVQAPPPDGKGGGCAAAAHRRGGAAADDAPARAAGQHPGRHAGVPAGGPQLFDQPIWARRQWHLGRRDGAGTWRDAGGVGLERRAAVWVRRWGGGEVWGVPGWGRVGCGR